MVIRQAALWILFLLAACTAGLPAALPAAPSPFPVMDTLPSATPAHPLSPVPRLPAQVIDTLGENTPVHDPTLIKAGDTYYLFSTGAGVSIRCSTDLSRWTWCGRVFGVNPEWAATAILGVKDLWAPDIVFSQGKYYLYYSASTFGSNRSAIGLVTNTTLDPKDPAYAWVDQGEVVSSQKLDRFNAIDPNLAFDAQGWPWLAFGSFWGGIQLVKIDPATMKPEPGAERTILAAKPGSDAVEGAFLTRRGEFYYLFVSHDYCCKGVNSTYNIRVGRSAEITGPYVDREGRPLTQGGGSLVLQGSSRWKGPGHNSIYIENGTYFMVYHAYDVQAAGAPTLRIERLDWDAEGWPAAPSAGPDR